MFTYKSLLRFNIRLVHCQDSCACESLGSYLLNLMYYQSRQGQRKRWLLVETNNLFNLFQMICCWFSIPGQIKFTYSMQ